MRELKKLAQKAERIYRNNLEEMLKHINEIVAIDTTSGKYVFGKTITEAMKKYMDLGYTKGKMVVRRLDEKPRLTYLGIIKKLVA
jgi:Trk K+ transport system NAD-binding subunit